MATKNLCFLLMFNHKCAKFYLILEQMQILVGTSQFLLKGHKMFNFLIAFFLMISETLKAHISGMEADINRQ